MEKCSLAPESRQSQHATAYVTIQWSADRSSSSSNSGASQSINTVCVTLETDSLWKGDLNDCSEKKFFFLAFLSKKVNIYIYIKHRYKKVSSTSCVWQHLLHREVPLILRCKDQAHFCCESKYQKWWELHILCWPFFWKDPLSFTLNQGTTMRRLQLRWSTSSSSTIHAGNSGRHQLGWETPRGPRDRHVRSLFFPYWM